jgi:hypothetical protein
VIAIQDLELVSPDLISDPERRNILAILHTALDLPQGAVRNDTWVIINTSLPQLTAKRTFEAVMLFNTSLRGNTLWIATTERCLTQHVSASLRTVGVDVGYRELYEHEHMPEHSPNAPEVLGGVSSIFLGLLTSALFAMRPLPNLTTMTIIIHNVSFSGRFASHELTPHFRVAPLCPFSSRSRLGPSQLSRGTSFSSGCGS